MKSVSNIVLFLMLFYRYLFQFAHILNGIGTAALLTLGMTYLDENVEQKVSSLYHGKCVTVYRAGLYVLMRYNNGRPCTCRNHFRIGSQRFNCQIPKRHNPSAAQAKQYFHKCFFWQGLSKNNFKEFD